MQISENKIANTIYKCHQFFEFFSVIFFVICVGSVWYQFCKGGCKLFVSVVVGVFSCFDFDIISFFCYFHNTPTHFMLYVLKIFLRSSFCFVLSISFYFIHISPFVLILAFSLFRFFRVEYFVLFFGKTIMDFSIWFSFLALRFRCVRW